MQEYKIDAAGKRIGRVASEAALALRGKHLSSFRPNQLPGVRVLVINASNMVIDDKKRNGHLYTRYSGYPGGLKYEKLGTVIERKGYTEVLKRAVYGMLPTNRLRAKAMKLLEITE